MARLYGVPVEAVLSANSDLVPEHIPAGAMIVIPEPPGGWVVYRAQAGETLGILAQRYGFPLDEGFTLNPGVSPERIAGQDIRLPRATLDPVTATATVASPATETVATPPLPSETEPAAGQWVEVRLADGSKAWAPRATMLTYSKAPLPAPQVVEVAQRFRGTNYVWGGQTPNGVDCSGYVQQVFCMGGHQLPRMADDQFNATVPVAQEEAQPGDLVFFTTYQPGPSHVGIYLGNGRFVHASSSRGVTETGLDDPYFSKRCLGIRRIKEWANPGDAASLPPQH
jgi:cell wall-associated NlpC family hydrolase